MANDWLETLSEARRIIQRKEREKVAVDRTHHTPAERKQTVVNGDISRDPVNKQAAMLLSKSTDWLAKPDAVLHQRTNTMKPTHLPARHPTHPMQLVHGDTVEDETSKDDWERQIGEETVKRKDRLNDKTIDLALRVIEARETLEWHTSHVARSWLDWQDAADKRLHDLRMTRMAIDNEAKLLLAACGDVRQFFLDDKHVEEISRLKEFISLCERLEALKKRGTLDALADTILKLASS